MASHKLILEDDYQEEFSLIAIHCSEEPYKMAYMLNKHLSLRLSRKRLDVDFSNKGLDISFPLFECENELSYIIYNLVSNKNKSLTAKFQSSGSRLPGMFLRTRNKQIPRELHRFFCRKSLNSPC